MEDFIYSANFTVLKWDFHLEVYAIKLYGKDHHSLLSIDSDADVIITGNKFYGERKDSSFCCESFSQLFRSNFMKTFYWKMFSRLETWSIHCVSKSAQRMLERGLRDESLRFTSPAAR